MFGSVAALGCARVLELDSYRSSAGVDGGAAGTASAGWVDIAPGTFLMGSPPSELGRLADETLHTVTISRPFSIKATPVTQKEWRDVIASQPAHFSSCGDDCPVEMVSWYEALAYCNGLSAREGLPPCYLVGEQPYTLEHAAQRLEPAWTADLDCLGYRLPTEAEWEYAARAESTTALHTGDLSDTDCDDASMAAAGWYCGNASVEYLGCEDAQDAGGGPCAGPHPVGLKAPNDWGLFDVHGNVWEWVWDWYGTYGGDAVDPLGSESGEQRVGRGGSWLVKASYCRSAKRFTGAPGGRANHLGFRVARTK
jgi:formylglycine-generating enzyme required for sulfatase activity